MADPVPTFPEIKLDEFGGSALRNAEFSGFVADILAALGDDAATLFAEAITPVLAQAKDEFDTFRFYPDYYPQTEEINVKDALRDKLVRLMFLVYRRFLAFPEGTTFYTSVRVIKPVMKNFMQLGEANIAIQNSDVTQLVSALAGETNAAALTALGLKPLYDALAVVQPAIVTLYRARETEMGARKAARGGRTTAEVRESVAELIKRVIVICNGAYAIQPTATAQACMQTLSGVIMQYKDVAARNQGRATSGEDAGQDDENNPRPDDDTPAEGDEGGSDEPSEHEVTIDGE